MTLQKVIRKGAYSLIEAQHRSPIVENKYGRAYSFLTPIGFCLVGVHAWEIDDGWFDMRWRVLLGEIGSSFNFKQAMEDNHRNCETPYGMVSLLGKEILSVTDTYRFLVSWGSEKIVRVMVIRFGGGFSIPYKLPGVVPLTGEFYWKAFENYRFKLLSQSIES